MKRRDGSDPKYIQATVKHPAYLMVWGCFSFHGTGKLIILPCNETVKKEKYFGLLVNHMEECFDMTKADFLQQDGAPSHTAKLIKDYLSFCDINYFDDWPGNSPDLNPIENLWGIMKSRLRDRDVSSIPRLEAAIREGWDNLPPELLQNLVLSIPRHLKAVIKAKGGTTRY